jgi:Tfp pilus assembly protein PilF
MDEREIFPETSEGGLPMKRTKKRDGYLFEKGSFLLLCTALVVTVFIAGCSQWQRYLDTGHAGKSRTPSKVTSRQVARTIAGVRPLKGNPDSHYRLALHYQKRGRHHEALQEFKKTVGINPRHVNALNGIGVSYDNLKHFSRAQAAYRAALKIKPDSAEILNNLGYSLFLQGKFEEAQAALGGALDHDGTNRRYRNNLALVRFETGDFNGAQREYAHSMGEAPAHVLMGSSYYRIGMYREAADHFSRALKVDPEVKGAKGGLSAALSMIEIETPALAATEAGSTRMQKEGTAATAAAEPGGGIQGEALIGGRIAAAEDALVSEEAESLKTEDVAGTIKAVTDTATTSGEDLLRVEKAVAEAVVADPVPVMPEVAVDVTPGEAVTTALPVTEEIGTDLEAVPEKITAAAAAVPEESVSSPAALVIEGVAVDVSPVEPAVESLRSAEDMASEVEISLEDLAVTEPALPGDGVPAREESSLTEIAVAPSADEIVSAPESPSENLTAAAAAVQNAAVTTMTAAMVEETAVETGAGEIPEQLLATKVATGGEKVPVPAGISAPEIAVPAPAAPEMYVLARCHVTERDGTRVTVLRYMDLESYMDSLGIEVVNRSGDGSFSSAVGGYLRDRGYRKVALLEPGKETTWKTKIYYRTDYLQSAFRVAGDIPGYQEMEEVRDFSSSETKVRVVIGEDMVRHAAVFSGRDKYALSAHR